MYTNTGMKKISFKTNLKKNSVKKSGKGLFWTWIVYQIIKGTTTTTLIWAPLIYMWFHN